MDTLALTDRDGTYGAVKFARACLTAGIRPVLGVDLAYRTSSDRVESRTRTRTPVRGGAYREDRLPRVTLLAGAGGAGGGGARWGAMFPPGPPLPPAGERGKPLVDSALLPPLLAFGHLLV